MPARFVIVPRLRDLDSPDAGASVEEPIPIVPGNPWTFSAGLAGLCSLLLGLFLVLYQGSDNADVDPVRLVVGLSFTSVAGTLLTCWLILGGIGWYLRKQRQ